MTSRGDRLDDDIARERRRARETRERDDGDDTDGIDVDAPVAHRATAIERRVTIIDRIE